MSPEIQLLVIFLAFLGLLCLGMKVPFAIIVPAMGYLFLQSGLAGFKALGLVGWGSMNSFILTSVPLFVLMAEIMLRSGVTVSVYRGLSKLVARIPGGLLQTNILGCATFATISGSSIVTAASIGGVALPELMRRNYDPKLSAGSLAGGGTLGILIPPSLALIIYSSMTELSVAKLFMAGVGPGLLLTAMFMTYIGVIATLRPEVAPRDTTKLSPRAFFVAILEILPLAVLVLLVLGTIYAGLATPTESAALGCVFAVIIGALFGNLTKQSVMEALRSTVSVIGNVMFIVLAAYVFAYAISYAGVGEDLAQWVVDLNLQKWEFLLAVFVLYTILGCFVESIGIIVITVPLLFPILPAFGIDPFWFGIVLVIFIEMGQISPPIGINLYVVQAMWNGKLSDVVLGTIPFHLLMILLLVLLWIWPDIALWFPSRL